jgi:hypothetical protein
MPTIVEPTQHKIAERQRIEDEKMLAVNPAWPQRTSPDAARNAIVFDQIEAYNKTRDEKAWAEFRAVKGAGQRDPVESKAAWAEKYEVRQNADKSVSYHRDGQERIRDGADRVSVLASDQDSIRDAVRLARGKWGSELHVGIRDPAKRDAVLTECVRQGVVTVQPELAERYAEIRAEVERERAREAKAAPEPERHREVEHERDEM